ncbi:hypothetical protein N7533_008708 [Penicillium manginii]|uniref:uncharacterized protein n=1 Tax=Penicillium manginii TaxID=203109 RepID=UPI00254785B5|nr:uncharacterized protein N7533_008708 [Penicillium manginii]KAJ5743838.1 hypothetical protein N7533_008708 [Penicillium manginii]
MRLLLSPLAVIVGTPLAAGYLVAPPGTAFPGTISTCSEWVAYASGMTCASIESTYGITAAEFATWNPDCVLGGSCSVITGFDYCIEVNYGTISASSASSTTSTSTQTTFVTSTTTTAGNGVTTPTPIQAGMVDNCNSFHMVVSDDTCATIASAAGISQTDFADYNPGVGSGCSSLWLGYYVCTGIIGETASKTTVASTTTAGNGITTPTPTQTGMVDNCNSFHMVDSGDSCQTIATAAGIVLADFYSWNSGVGSGCSSLWLGYYVCTGVVGSTPTTTAATTTTAGNGISTPTPTQAGMVGNCNSFHMVVSDDTCATIASEAGISTTDFYSWNSGVGSGCSSLWLGYYVCTGVIGSTPTTTKKTTTSTGNGVTTPTPTQPGIVSNCNKFHEVVSGDGCQAIANAAGITLAQFEAWNTQVGSSCSTLWLGYYVCIGIL